MQVKDVMSKEVISVRRSTTLKELLDKFSKFHIFPLVPVVEEEQLVGIVSFRNLMNAFQIQKPEMLKAVTFMEEEEDIFQIEFTEEMGSLVIAEDIMETKFASVSKDATLQEAYKLMKLHLKEEFPVIDKGGRLVGMVGVFDIVRVLFHKKGLV